MAKDKLITLLITEEKRDRLKQHCADLGLNVSQVLTKCIDDILAGSIDPSTSSQTTSLPIDIDIAIDAAIDKREPKLLDIIFNPTNEINTKLKEHDDDIYELENALYTCQTMLKTLTELVSKKGIGNVELDPTTKQALAHTVKPETPYKTHSSDEMYLRSEPFTIEETKEFLTRVYKANFETTKISARTSQDTIAELLISSSYPHPNNRKWTRDEVRKVCKMWEIATK